MSVCYVYVCIFIYIHVCMLVRDYAHMCMHVLHVFLYVIGRWPMPCIRVLCVIRAVLIKGSLGACQCFSVYVCGCVEQQKEVAMYNKSVRALFTKGA